MCKVLEAEDDGVKIEKCWFTVSEAAEYLGCSQAFLNKDRGARLLGIPFCRMGRHIRYERSQLDAWLKSHEVCTRELEKNHVQ